MKRFFNLKNKNGAALLFAVMVLMFLATVSIAFTMLATTAYKTASRDVSRQQSFYYARSVGLAISEQLIENYNMSDIVKHLDEYQELKGSYSIEKAGNINDLVVNGTDNIRFYYPEAGVVNQNFIYLDVITTYNGATEVVTSVFTCIDENDLDDNMFNLFSVYNIYSTSPNEQKFNFANTAELSTTGVSPSVYLYNGEGQGAATYKLENNVKAKLTSTGTVTVESKSTTIYAISGKVTSYGDITLRRIAINDNVYVSGDIDIQGNNGATVSGNMFVRGNVTIKGNGATHEVCTGTIYATGDVTVTNAKVGTIVGGENSNVKVSNGATKAIKTRGTLTISSSTVSGDVFSGKNFSITGSTVSGSINSQGTAGSKISSSTIGEDLGVRNRIVKTIGDLDITSGSVIYANVNVGGTLTNVSNINVSTIHGFLSVAKSKLVSGINSVALIGLNVKSIVDLRAAGVPPSFYVSGGDSKTKIEDVLLVGGDFSNDTLAINLYKAVLQDIQAAKVNKDGTVEFMNVNITNGNINGAIVGKNVKINNISTNNIFIINAYGNEETQEGGNVEIDNTVIKGNVYAEGRVIIGAGAEIEASKTTTVRAAHKYDNSEASMNDKASILSGTARGELIVDGNLIIKNTAQLYGNDLERYIYVKEDLVVDEHLKSLNRKREGSTTSPPKIGNRIYVNGKATLRGKVGDIYLMGVDYGVDKLKIIQPSSSYEPAGVNGVQKLMVKEKLIRKADNINALEMKGFDSIVCIVEDGVKFTGALHISGTLVIPENFSGLVFGDIYANKLITVPQLPVGLTDSELLGWLGTLSDTGNAVINSEITGTLYTNSALNNVTIKKSIDGAVKLDNVKTKVSVGNATGSNITIGGAISAEKATVSLTRSTVDSIKAKELELSNSSIVNKNIVVTGKTTIYLGCKVGASSTATNVYTLSAGSVDSYGEIRSSIVSGGKVEIQSTCLVNYDVQAATLMVYNSVSGSGTINGDVRITGTGTSTIYGTIKGNLQSNGTVNITGGTVSSGKFVRVKTSLNMTGGTLGSGTNVHIENTGTTADNKIIATTLNNVRVEVGKTTTIDVSSKITGTVYVGGSGSVVFSNKASAEKGLYCGNSTTSITSEKFSKISGTVAMPNYTGTAAFGEVTGDFYAPKIASVTFSGSVGGNIRANNVTLHPISSTAVTYNTLDIGGYLTILSYSSGTMTFNSAITTNTLVVNCSISTYTSVDSSYSPPTSSGYLSSASTSRTAVYFRSNVRVDYLSSTYRGNAYIRNASFRASSFSSSVGSTLYVDGGIYANYVDFYSYGYADETNHTPSGTASDGYNKSMYGSFHGGLDSTNSNYFYLENIRTYSNIDIRKSSGVTIKNSEIGVNKGNMKGVSETNKKRFSRYYHFAGGLTLNNTKIYGVNDTSSGDHDEKCMVIVHVSSGNLVLQSSSWIGYWHKDAGQATAEPARGHRSKFRGIYVSSGNLTNGSGCMITSNIYVNGNIINNGVINIKGNDGYNYCAGEVFYSGSVTNNGWLYILHNDTHISWESHRNAIYKKVTTTSTYTPSSHWQLTTLINGTTVNNVVKAPNTLVTSYNSAAFTKPTYTVTGVTEKSVNVPTTTFEDAEYEQMKNTESPEPFPWRVEIYNINRLNSILPNPIAPSSQSLHNDVRSTENWNPIAIPLKWNLPTKTTAGKTVALNNRTNNELSINIKNITFELNNILGSITGVNHRIGQTAHNAELYQWKAKDINKVMEDKGSADAVYYKRLFVYKNPDASWWEFWKWVTASSRPVGMTFFESGVVPSAVFGSSEPWREDNHKSEDNERWLWGNPGLFAGEGSGVLGDCVWTFFACADPRNPYTSAAKDLHIILPQNATMEWLKDKDNSVNIIGHGRVFLYLQSGTNMKIMGNGFVNWLADFVNIKSINTFGSVRYADKKTGNLTNVKNSNNILQPRLFLIGVGGGIKFEVADFQTMAYVYMPRGYSYNNKKNEFIIRATNSFFSSGSGSGQWDIYGMYVTDVFSYGRAADAKVNYQANVPDLSNTIINGQEYRLSEFWDYPQDLPRSGLTWKYRGIVMKPAV